MKKIGSIFGVAAFWIGCWYGLYFLVNKPLLLPSPHAVGIRLFELLQTKAFYLSAGRSLLNAFFGIVIATAMGILLVALATAIPGVKALVSPFMTVVKSTPVASFIVLLLVFVGATAVPSYITGLVVLPILWTNLEEGIRQIDPKLSEVTRVFGFSKWKRIKYLTVPSVMPYFSSAMRTSLGLGWKAGIAAEIIALPAKTIGTQIGTAKQYIQVTDLFAWTLAVILLSLLIECGLKKLLARLSEKGGRHRAEI